MKTCCSIVTGKRFVKRLTPVVVSMTRAMVLRRQRQRWVRREMAMVMTTMATAVTVLAGMVVMAAMALAVVAVMVAVAVAALGVVNRMTPLPTFKMLLMVAFLTMRGRSAWPQGRRRRRSTLATVAVNLLLTSAVMVLEPPRLMVAAPPPPWQ